MEEHPVRATDRGDPVRFDTRPTEPHDVDAAEFVQARDVAKGRHVTTRRRRTLDHGQTTDANSLVDDGIAREERAIADLDVTSEQSAIGESHTVTDPTIMGGVTIGHEEAIAPDPRLGIRGGAAMHGRPLAEDVAIADDHARRGSAVAAILRLVTEHCPHVDDIVAPQRGAAAEVGAGLDPRSIADANSILDDRERADRHALSLIHI